MNSKKRTVKRLATLCLAAVLTIGMLAGCGADKNAVDDKKEDGIDYLVLVNKLNKLPDDWEDKLTTEKFTNTVGDEVEVETKAYEAYLKLKEDLEKEDIHVDLDSARRSVDEQQRIWDDFTEKYGEAYTAKTVAKPGYSEHHTGLALDLYLIIDGKDVVENEDMIKYTDIWAKIHEKLPQYGFILRYLEGKEHITGYGYEPWHIRYIDDPEKAADITKKGITLETYLGEAADTDVELDYGKSEIYDKATLDEAFVQTKCYFASWKGCELHKLAYAGDDKLTNVKENLDWVNSLEGGGDYVKVMEITGNFHSPKDNKGTAWEPDMEYEDYQFWLGMDEEGSWSVVSTGY